MISVVVPVYNASKYISETVVSIIAELDNLKFDYELILVDDCSPDGTWEQLNKMKNSYGDKLKIIKLIKNYGQHASTICGISKTVGDIIITMDDNEHNPKYLKDLIKQLDLGYDLVYGIFPKRTHKLWRNVTSNISRKLFSIAIPGLNFEYTSFRAMKKNVGIELCKFDSSFPFVDGYLSWITNNYSYIELKHGERNDSSSNYSFKKLLSHTINIFISFSDLPLKVSGFLGSLFAFVGFIFAFYLILMRIFGQITVSGYASMVAIVLFMGGIQLIVLNILGSYISRISFNTSKKPLYIIDKEK